METKLYIESPQNGKELLPLVRAAIEAEINKLELAMELANKRLAPFEERYNVTSAYFIENWAAENLNGGDDEYVSWVGEYQLQQRLQKRLLQLKEIQYVDTELLRSH